MATPSLPPVPGEWTAVGNWLTLGQPLLWQQVTGPEDKEGQGGMTGLQSRQLADWLLAYRAAYPKSHIQTGTHWAKEILALWNRN